MFLKKIFQKKKKRSGKRRSKYKVTVDSENLAFPEIHIKPSAGKHINDIDDKAKRNRDNV